MIAVGLIAPSRAPSAVSVPEASNSTRRLSLLPAQGAVLRRHLPSSSADRLSLPGIHAGNRVHPPHGLVAKALGPQEVAQLAEFEVESGFLYLPTWTPDQLAGLAFGAFMVACFYLAQNFDEWVAEQQREELGICRKCGGLNDPDVCKEGSCPMK